MNRKSNAGKAAALAAALAGALATSAGAATSASLTVVVTVNASLSLNIGGATQYNFGTVSPSTVVASTQAIVITNDSTGLTEDYTIASSTFIATGGVNWNLTGTLAGAQDQFGLCAKINPTAVSTSTFASTDCLATSGAQQNMDLSHFGAGGSDGSNTNGDHVPAAATRNLWLYFAAPTGITSGVGAQQSVSVTLTANAASLFP
jgi:hypothetical protein